MHDEILLRGFMETILGTELQEWQMDILRRMATIYSNKEKFESVRMPRVSRGMVPSLIANEIVGVQPMTGQTGPVFPLRFKFGEDEKFFEELPDELFEI